MHIYIPIHHLFIYFAVAYLFVFLGNPFEHFSPAREQYTHIVSRIHYRSRFFHLTFRLYQQFELSVVNYFYHKSTLSSFFFSSAIYYFFCCVCYLPLSCFLILNFRFFFFFWNLFCVCVCLFKTKEDKPSSILTPIII